MHLELAHTSRGTCSASNQSIPVLTFSPEHTKLQLGLKQHQISLSTLLLIQERICLLGFRCHRRVLVINTLSRVIASRRGFLPTSCLHSTWNLSKWVSNLQAGTSLVLLKECTRFSLAKVVCHNSHPLNYCYLRRTPHLTWAMGVGKTKLRRRGWKK